MSAPDLQVHEDAAAAKRRQRTVWLITVLVLGALLGLRAWVGTDVGWAGSPEKPAIEEKMNGFGLAFVQPTHKKFVPLTAAEMSAKIEEIKKAGGTTGNSDQPKWREAKPNERADIEWTEWKLSSPADYVIAKADPANKQGIVFSWPRTIGIWLAAFFTLAVFSFLAGDNPAYKFTEAVVVGVSAAYWMVEAFWATLVPKLFFALAPTLTKATILPLSADLPSPDGFQWLENFGASPSSIAFGVALIPLTLGVLLLCRLNRKTSWLGIFPLGFIVGTFAGLKFVSFTESDLLGQVATMFQPLIVVKHEAAAVAGSAGSAVGVAQVSQAINVAGSVGGTISAVLVFVGVLTVLVYFFFSLEHKGIVGRTARVGIWFLMITFGASFGYTVMGRIALLAGRFEFLFNDWLWLVDPSRVH